MKKNILLLMALVFFASCRHDTQDANFNEQNTQDVEKTQSTNQQEIIPYADSILDTTISDPPSKITLLAVGDIMLSRHVGSKIIESGDNRLPFTKTAFSTSDADIAFGNLESPFYDKGPRVTEGMVFKAEPEFIEGLTYAGFDILSIANNHALNQGVAGVSYTLDWLETHGIASVGGGKNSQIAHQGKIIEKNGINFGFLAYSYLGYNDSPTSTNPIIAEMNEPNLRKDVTALREKSDIVIVSMHAGTEYVNFPTDQQTSFAHTAIDSGADMVIGHHPHWPQIVEKYKDKWIIYSLGNFVFDQEWSQETKEGLMLKATFDNTELSHLELIPVIIENYSTPRLTTNAEAYTILQKIQLESAVLYNKE